MSWLQASCLLLLAWAIMSTQARSIAKTKREIEIPYKNVTNMEMELEENPKPTKKAITIDPDIVVGTESESKLVTEKTTNGEQPVGETTTPSEFKIPVLETKVTTLPLHTTTESMPIVQPNTTTTRSLDQGRSMQIFMTTERSFSVTPMKLQPLIISTTVRSTAMPAQAASHENDIDEDTKSTTSIILGHQLPEKRAKFISENSTNAQQLSPEVWGLAAMMNALPKSSTTSTTTESMLPNDIETQEIDQMKNITDQHYEKNVLDWQNVENMRENRTEFVVSTTLDATEGSAKAMEETTESLRSSKITETAELNITTAGTTTVKPSVTAGLTEEPLVQKVTKLADTSTTSTTTTIANDLDKLSESMVTTTSTESTSEAWDSKLQFVQTAPVNKTETSTTTGLTVKPVIEKLATLEETTATALNNWDAEAINKTDVVEKISSSPEEATTTESAKSNYVDLTPAINSDLIINTKSTTESTSTTTLEPEPEVELKRNLDVTTTPKPDLTGEPVVHRLATADITEPAATLTTTTAATATTVISNDLNLAASTPPAIQISNELKQTTSTTTTPTSNDLYLTAAKMLELTETATTTTEPSAVIDITKNITTHNHIHMPNTETTTTTSNEMAMKTTTITATTTTTTEAYDVTSSASTNKDSETASQRATVEQLSTATTPKEIAQISNEVEITTVRNLKEIEADKISATTTTTTARTTVGETAEKTNNNNNNNNNSESEVPATTIIPRITTTATTITEIIDNRLQNLTEAAPAGANQTPTIAKNTTIIGETKLAATDLYDEDNNGAQEDDVADDNDEDVKRQQVDVDNNTVMATTTTTPVPPLISLLDDSTSSTTTTTTISTTPLPSTSIKMLPEVTATTTNPPPPPPAPTTLSPIYSSSPNPSPSPSPTPSPHPSSKPTLMPTLTNEFELDAIQTAHPQPNSQGTDVNVIIAITVSVIGVVALILLVAFLYLMRKRQKQMSYGQRCRPVSLDAYSLDNVSVLGSVRRGKGGRDLRASKRTYGNAAFDDPSLRHNLLSAHELGKFVTQRSTLFEEFRDVPQIIARADEVPAGCEDKNRYANVIPLPETRVVLQRQNDDDKTEYINANYVRGPRDAPNYYIACQAPLESTTADFWRMIWEQQSRVIIQATDLSEEGIERCAEYLPPSATLDNHSSYGDYQVTLKNREVKDKYAISTLMLKHVDGGEECRELTHYWYKWPERGVPADEAPIIAMLLEARSSLKTYCLEEQQQEQKQKEKDAETEAGGSNEINGNNVNIVKATGRQQQGPLTIHCSPGTGRTGTIIASDMAIRSLETPKRSVDIPQLVYYVRRGRASAVQTKEQYEFIYKVANMYATKITNLSNDN